MRCYAAEREVTTTPTTLRGAQVETASATNTIFFLEVGCFNTTTTACTAALQRFTASGTVGASITEQAEDSTFTPLAVASGVNSTDMTASGGKYVQASLGAAIGAGVIWTFGGKGLRVTGATDAGMCLICPSGTGQFRDFYWVWEE